MPFTPELFSARVLERLEEQRRHELASVPYFDGLLAGEPDALVKSFAGVPELHDPVRGRVKSVRAFEAFVSEASSWLRGHNVSVEHVEHVITERQGFDEVVLHLDGQVGRVDLPVAIVADRRSDGRIDELRIYFSNWPLAGRHTHRPPLSPAADLFQQLATRRPPHPPSTSVAADPELLESDVVGDHQRALAAGDVDTIVAAFEPDGYAREPAGGRRVHRHLDGLSSFYELLFSNGGGIPLEHCAVIDDGRACALEYIVVRWGRTELAAADQGVGLARALRTGRPRPRRPSVRAAFRPTSAAAERAGDARLIAEYLSQSPADLST